MTERCPTLGRTVYWYAVERFAGGFEQPVPMAEWNDHHYEAFTEARKKIEGTKPEERAALVRELFQLGPGAEG
jgi:hypothetical protein